MKSPVALAPLLMLLVACERPFVPVRAPEIEVVTPDLTEVQTNARLKLAVRATSFRAIAHVEVEGRPMRYDSLRDVWVGEVSLQHGLNRLRITAVDEKGVAATDTAWALHLQATVQPGPPLPAGRGGGRLLRLSDGRVLFAGGAEVWTGPASHDLYVWTPEAPTFERLNPGLRAPRAGHTATLLSDGRVLLLGGSVRGRPALAEELRSDAELLDLEKSARQLLPIVASAARAWHATALRRYEGRRFLEVLGGYRRLRSGSPDLGAAADLITFELKEDSLVLLTPGLGLYLTPLAAHIMAPLDAAGTRFLVAGSLSMPGGYLETQTFRLVLEPAGWVDTLGAPPLPEPRQFATAVMLRPGVVVLIGGYADQFLQPYSYVLLYLEAANRFFRFRALPLQPRFDASATLIGDFRILVTGGFGPNGQGLSQTEIVAFMPF
ncbi:kelch repeat-containing protein [Rhodothermus profundi]|uniref:Galactose oxidase, central domain n=1 Tax=Rhodothermus profundi TaxID=633813 RepID=A0A1M6UMQ2_9BACT|nr:kelch repeat-containing protein [Rhodothermus profundi]SHK70535.1 hypothetical protein SAMN04488087_1781 [Rhodothermus profundi]